METDNRWNIDLDWYDKNGCSFFAVAQGYFCPKCSKKIKSTPSAGEVIQTISGCCSRYSGFFKPNAPVLSTVFQIFLKNGNQPLDVDDLSKELALRRVQPAIPAERLERILRTDNYYGLRPIR